MGVGKSRQQAVSSAFLSSELKALWESMVMTILDVDVAFRSQYCEIVWMAASRPKGHATPTWSEPKNLWAALRTAERRHVLVNRRQTIPTAMGHTSPFASARATRLAPDKCIDSERWPLLAKLLTTVSNACRATSCSTPQTASSKCWA